MFSLVSGVYDAYLAPTQLNLLVVGASGVGKTALLERLKVTQFTKNKKPAQQQLLDENPPLPESFLPVALREKQKELVAIRRFSSHDNKGPIKQRQKKKKKKKAKKSSQQQQAANHPPQHQQQQQPEETTQRRSFLKCPAPSRYAKQDSSDSDDEIDEEVEEEDSTTGRNEEEDDEGDLVPPDKKTENGITDNFRQTSLEDVPLGDSERRKSSEVNSSENETAEGGGVDDNACSSDDDDEEDQQFDLKSKLRMLPLHKIRPTIGMNLGKVEICGAQCHVWDLGGKMHDLWSRYYQDCDAVVFVWKIVDDSDPPQTTKGGGDDGDDDNDSDDDDRLPPVTAAQQLALLEQVRASIPDDVPFLIWGHWFPQTILPTDKGKKNTLYRYDEAYSTAALLPHYHNPLMTTYCGSAKTGAGVRTAIEWLIPIAARQKKFRDKSPLLPLPGDGFKA